MVRIYYILFPDKLSRHTADACNCQLRHAAVLGEACMVEVGQGIQLLRGEPTPRLLCGERTLKAVL